MILSLLLPGLPEGAEKKPIRLAYLQNDIHHLACWVALEKGFYAQEGLEVTVAGIFKAGPELMTAFSAGALDMAYVGEAPATTAVANKTARVVVLAQVNTEGSVLWSARSLAGNPWLIWPAGLWPFPDTGRCRTCCCARPCCRLSWIRNRSHPGLEAAGNDRGFTERRH